MQGDVLKEKRVNVSKGSGSDVFREAQMLQREMANVKRELKKKKLEKIMTEEKLSIAKIRTKELENERKKNRLETKRLKEEESRVKWVLEELQRRESRIIPQMTDEERRVRGLQRGLARIDERFAKLKEANFKMEREYRGLERKIQARLRGKE